jgi:hypothetical protein
MSVESFPGPSGIHSFRASTVTESLRLKALFELLAQNLTTACFTLTADGMSLRMTDSNSRILFDITLPATSFTEYSLSGDRTIGINLQHMKRVLRTLKKHDKVTFVIDSEHPLNFFIEVETLQNKTDAAVCCTTSSITMQCLRSVVVEMDREPYAGVGTIIATGKFQKMIKDLHDIGKCVELTADCQGGLRFRSTTGGIITREVLYNGSPATFVAGKGQTFPSDVLCRLAKLTTLNSTVKLVQRPDLPLLVEVLIGTLGVLTIFLKQQDPAP